MVFLQNNYIEIVELLLNNPEIEINSISKINGNEETPLHTIIKNNNIEIVKLLITFSNVEINSCFSCSSFFKDTQLSAAIKNNDNQMVIQ